MKNQVLKTLNFSAAALLMTATFCNIASAAINNNQYYSSESNRTSIKVIYGGDDRVEAHEHPDRRLRHMAKSVAGMVAKHHLSAPVNLSEIERLRQLIDPEIFKEYIDFFTDMAGKKMNTAFSINQSRTLSDANRVCKDERFANQRVLPVCTGFLIAPDVLLTAGHCVRTESSCRDYVWVFDYLDKTDKVLKKDVYTCKEVIGQNYSTGLFSARDYAIIRLDRKSEREPLELRSKGSVDKGDEIAVIGHPSGLPLKIADNAKVRKNYLFTFKTDLDTFAGNSGSPVINTREGIVEGILVEGADDYIIDRHHSCLRVSRPSNGASDGNERVFKITRIKELDDLL